MQEADKFRGAGLACPTGLGFSLLIHTWNMSTVPCRPRRSWQQSKQTPKRDWEPEQEVRVAKRKENAFSCQI